MVARDGRAAAPLLTLTRLKFRVAVLSLFFCVAAVECRDRSAGLLGRTSPPASACTDFSPRRDCAAWKAAGECDKNRPFMKRNCALSCGTCDLQLSTYGVLGDHKTQGAVPFNRGDAEDEEDGDDAEVTRQVSKSGLPPWCTVCHLMLCHLVAGKYERNRSKPA